MSTSPLTLDSIVIPKIRGNRILDVGCGYGKWSFLTKKYFWNTQNGNLVERPFVAGLDLHSPNIEKECFREGIEDMNGHNPHEAHVSAWKIKTFKAFGYCCYGVGLKLWPSWFWGVPEFTYFSYRIPFISDMLVCVKLLNQ